METAMVFEQGSGGLLEEHQIGPHLFELSGITVNVWYVEFPECGRLDG